ncbi:MAG: O-antigen ligase family protein [Lachnospiraceae bacterium]|nr:O-antigen ligase family protein [Lachnospiraceae bacterium]
MVTWRIIGIIWYLAEPEFRLEPMPQYIMQSPWIWIAVAALAAVYLFIRKKTGERVRFDMAKYRYLGILYTCLVALAIGAVVVYIILNTKEVLPESLRSHANYLLFDAQWGNGRGAIWHDTLASLSEEFKKAPVTAIFGVGPDQYFNIIDEYVNDWLVQYSDKVAMSAHNEWLNAFVNFGIFGGAAYLGIFISALIRFVKIRSKAPVALGAAVIVVAYLAHQMFGYQQFASTPYIFLVLGIGECAARRADTEQGKMNRD